jgi:ABC-type spermidine/putrescine transport system permease subunit II
VNRKPLLALLLAVVLTLSLVTGFGLPAEALLRLPLVHLVSPDVVAALSTVLLLATIAVLSLWTVSYANHAQRRAGGSANAGL